MLTKAHIYKYPIEMAKISNEIFYTVVLSPTLSHIKLTTSR
jgi:hypothetical protein